jgi:hypothetical protein
MQSMVITQHNPADLYPPYVNYAHAAEVAPNARTLYVSGLNGFAREGVSVERRRARAARQTATGMPRW